MKVCLGDTLTLMLPHVLEQVWKNTTISLDLHETNRFSAHISIHKKYFRNVHWNDVKNMLRKKEKKTYKNKTKQNFERQLSRANCEQMWHIKNTFTLQHSIFFSFSNVFRIHSQPSWVWFCCSLACSFSLTLSFTATLSDSIWSVVQFISLCFFSSHCHLCSVCYASPMEWLKAENEKQTLHIEYAWFGWCARSLI